MSRKRRGRNEGSVYQREQDGLWVGSVSLPKDGEGKRRRRIVYGTTKQEALDKLKQLGLGTIPEPGTMTVGNLCKMWLAGIKATVAGYTLRDYTRDVDKMIAPHIGGVRLDKLSTLHVQQLYNDLTTAGVSAAMQRKAGVSLGVALQYGIDQLKLKQIAHNVAHDVKKPKHTPKEMQVLDPDQVQKFLAEAKADRLYALYVFILDSGARIGEAFGLQWKDIDWKGRAVRIVRALEEIKGGLRLKDLKTKKSRRRVALTGFTMDALAEHRKAALAAGQYNPDASVFCDTDGGWLRKSNVQRRSFTPILERAGLPIIRPYDLRHSSATLLLLAGEDSKVVAERLGHSTTRLTQDTYQHVLPGMQERAASKLDAIFRQPAAAATS